MNCVPPITRTLTAPSSATVGGNATAGRARPIQRNDPNPCTDSSSPRWPASRRSTPSRREPASLTIRAWRGVAGDAPVLPDGEYGVDLTVAWRPAAIGGETGLVQSGDRRADRSGPDAG